MLSKVGINLDDSQELINLDVVKNHVLAHVVFCIKKWIDPHAAETQPTAISNWKKAININPKKKIDRMIVSYPLIRILKYFIENIDDLKWYEWQVAVAKEFNIDHLWTVYRIAWKLWCTNLLWWKLINLPLEVFNKIKKEISENETEYKQWCYLESYLTLMEKVGLTNPEILYWAISWLWLCKKLWFKKIKITNISTVKSIISYCRVKYPDRNSILSEEDIKIILKDIDMNESDEWRLKTVLRWMWYKLPQRVYVKKRSEVNDPTEQY